MCVALLQNMVRACGLGTRVRFCPLGEAGELAKTLLPCGRAAIFADGGAQMAQVRGQLADLRPVCAVIGREPLAGLFSLPDEVRVVVALGTRSIFAARFFATLRGGFVLAVPLSAAAEGVFEAALPQGYAQAGYPLRAPDIVLADEALLSGLSGAAGYAALAALCAEDLALHALFAEGAEDPAFSRAAEAFLSYGEGEKGLFCACSLLRLALRRSPVLPAVCAAEAYGGDAFPLFAHFAARYARFLEKEEPRRYFVPDFTGRVLRAAEVTGERAAALLKNIAVPTAAECRRRIQVFAEARGALRARGELLRSFVQRAGRLYAAHGGHIRAEDGKEGAAGRIAALYECAAELSPLFSVPAAEREFGLLADLPQSDLAKQMRAACG